MVRQSQPHGGRDRAIMPHVVTRHEPYRGRLTIARGGQRIEDSYPQAGDLLELMALEYHQSRLTDEGPNASGPDPIVEPQLMRPHQWQSRQAERARQLG